MAVIGGGIAGLAAALRVRTLDSSTSVTVLESSSILGGKILGDVVDGCVIDGGPDVCIGDRLKGTHMFNDLRLVKLMIRANADALPTYEWRDGCLVLLPTTYAGELLTFRGGMREIVNVVCDALTDVTLLTETLATALEMDGTRWRVDCANGDSHIADAVIIAAPASTAAALIPGIASKTADGLRELEYPATTTVTMAWHLDDVPRELDGTGYLAADPDAQMSACTWTSAKNPSHSPLDRALLRGYMRGAPTDPVALMRGELETVIGITAPPLFTHIFRFKSGIPTYSPAHRTTVYNLMAELDAVPGIFVAGSAFHGVGIPDCVLSGERAAAGALSYVRARRTGEMA